MAKIKFSINLQSSTNKLIIASVAFVIILSTALLIAISLSNKAREQAQQQLAQQFEAPKEAVKTQVKKVLYRYTDENGKVFYAEILITGQVNLYDENFNLLKSGIQGFARINNLLDYINRNSDGLDPNGEGDNSLTIETNKGTIVINFDDDLDDILDEIIDEIEDIIDDTFSPTPTPLPPTPTITPGGPIIPTSSPTPTTIQPSPTITPGGPTPTPTPLPDYMTAPPFTCEDYEALGRSVIISNVICGADQ